MSGIWRDAPISSLGRVITGTTPRAGTPSRFKGSFPFITPTDLEADRKAPAIARFLSTEAVAEATSRVVPRRSVAFTCIGATIGKMCVVDEASLTNQQINTIVVDETQHDSDFVYYRLLADRDDIKARAGGAATPIISKSAFEGITVRLPPLPIQRRIAAILSAYDDLIENNNRRIKILEEMAQRIYREWFVDFRYPGHENVPMVDSELGRTPSGWEVSSYSALGDYVNGYAFKPEDWGTDGLPIVKIRELKAGVKEDTPRYAQDLGTRFAVADGDLLFSWSADLDAYLWTGGPAWLNQHVFRVDPSEGIPRGFLFHALKESMGRFRELSQGTTMRHIKRVALTQVRSLLPPSALRSRFDNLTAPFASEALNLTTTIRTLRKTRDLLLPRLISGEIDVEKLNIAVPDAAA